MISDRSTGTTVMPDACSSFSLKRTVWNAAGRVPICPIRAPRMPRTTRQIRANRSRSAANPGLSTAQVCSAVSVHGMPYWYRLLQTDTLPQKASRRCSTSTLSRSSSKACTSTGTRSSAASRVCTMPSSSPKFGRLTMIPSIRARLAWKSAAYFAASARVSTAPFGVAFSSGITTP